MIRNVLTLIAMSIFVAACVHDPPPTRPFTDEWAAGISQSNQNDSSKKKDIILIKKKALGRPTITFDNEGKPKLRFGEKSRVGADVSLSGGDPEVDVSYTWRIRPVRRPPTPATPTPRSAERSHEAPVLP